MVINLIPKACSGLHPEKEPEGKKDEQKEASWLHYCIFSLFLEEVWG